MKSIKVLFAGLVFVLMATSASAVDITNAFMTNVQPTSCDASLLDEVSTFYDTDELACFFVSFENARQGDTYETKWFYEGELHISVDVATVGASGLKCMARTMKIKGSDAMNMPGAWKVQLYYNNEMRVEQSFEIQERCAAQAALHDDAASLKALRAFRERTLRATLYGRKAIELYYKVSPLLVKSMNGNPALKGGMRQLLKACAAVAEKFMEPHPQG